LDRLRYHRHAARPSPRLGAPGETGIAFMRIGFFTDTYTPQINGVVTSIKLFTDALERQGHEVYIFAPTPRQPADGSRVVRIPSVPFAFQPEMRLASIYSQHAYALARRANLDIIHSHDPFAIALFGLAVAKRFRLPYVHTYHTLYPEYVHYVWETRFTRAMAKRLSREFCDQCDLVLAPSTKIEKALAGWGVTAPVKLLPTGVDATRFGTADPSAAAALRARFGIPETDRLLTFVGRVGLEKNLDTLVEAIALVKTPGARLLVVGNGPYRADLDQHIAALGVEDRVTFTGYLQSDDVAAAYAASDLFLFASLSETQGLVIAEAMASGLPVVAVDDLAVSDAVTDGVNGLLTPERPDALAAAADRLLTDPSLRAIMGAESRRRAEDLSIDRMAARLSGFYAELAEQKPSPQRRHRVRAVGRVSRQITRLRRRSRVIINRYL
jgi:glycosyltransferase involved in cell wall biosynthesis